jgi:hypothetical protein
MSSGYFPASPGRNYMIMEHVRSTSVFLLSQITKISSWLKIAKDKEVSSNEENSAVGNMFHESRTITI